MITYKQLTIGALTIYAGWSVAYAATGNLPKEAPPTLPNVLAIFGLTTAGILIFFLIIHIIQNWDKKIF